MAQRDYSFLDIAVLDGVRARFAAADAIAILSTDLTEVIWANGPGAALFGHGDIESIMGAETGLPFAARRQIMATPGFPEIGTDRPLTVRLASGMTSRIVGFLGSRIALPGGEPAILLAVPFEQGASRSAGEISARAIGGFGEAGYHVALVDGRGRIEAASEGFADLVIAPETLETLAAEALAADDRLVKKLITAGTDQIPAGMARLRDDPPLCLFVAVGATESDFEAQPETAAPTIEPDVATPLAEIGVMAPVTDVAPSPAEESEIAAVPSEPSLPDGEPMPPVAEEQLPPIETTVEEIPPAFDTILSAEPTGEESAAAATPAAPPPTGEPAEEDRWYFGPGHDGPAEAKPIRPSAQEPAGERIAAAPPARADAAMPPVDRAAAPVRFVWRTDAEGRFSTISHEFASVVGAAAADVVGRRFADVASAFRLDPTGEIAGLLDRRDTWSGRSVLWPITDTDLCVPVDLAALPVYGRSRNFEGFRGFGVARTADAVVDPDATGLTLGRGSVADIEEAPAAEAAAQTPTGPETTASAADEAASLAASEAAEPASSPPETGPRREDPFKGEVPALTLVPKPERRFSDKIIRLAEHRPAANDRGLTPVEKNAFREIGDRLKKEGSAPDAEGPSAPAAVETAPQPLSEAAKSPVIEPTQPQEPTGPAEAAPEPRAAAETAATGTFEELTSAIETPPVATDVETDDFSPAGEGAEVFDTTERQTAPDRDDEIVAEEEGVESTEEVVAAFAPLTDDAADVPSDVAEEEPSAADVIPEEPVIASEAEEPATVEEPVGITEPAAEQAEEMGDQTEAPEAPTDEVDADQEESPSSTEPPVGAAVSAPDRSEEPAPVSVRTFLPSAFASSGGAPRPAVDTSILDKLPVPVLIHSGDVLHYANREFLEFTAYDSVKELAERGGLGVLFGDPYRDEGENDRADRKMRLRRGDGLELPVEALLQSVPWNGGKALLLALRKVGRMPVIAPATGLSVEEKNELEARIAELRTIIDTATDGVVLIGNDGTIRSISRPAEALFGVESADVGGKPFTALFAIESQRAARDYLNGLSENGVASVLNDGREVIGREAQGRFIPLFMTIGKLPNHGGYCAVVRDITQWKRAEEELTQSRAQAERASSQKTDFLARVSHEIRTPLNAIIGFSELMMDEKFGPIGNDRYRDYLRDINRSGNHVLDLVNDLLDISKIEAGEQEMSYEAVSLNDTLAETVAMMQPQANRERVIIRSSFASRLPEVVADLRSVRQIALNLLSNAIRYTQAGGQVVVSTAYEPSGDVVMRVRDTGIGMTQAEIEQALKPFKQISALKRGRNDGTGLGLPLTKAMVEANRARFIISSTPGEGTLVEITFPSTRVLAE